MKRTTRILLWAAVGLLNGALVGRILGFVVGKYVQEATSGGVQTAYHAGRIGALAGIVLGLLVAVVYAIRSKAPGTRPVTGLIVGVIGWLTCVGFLWPLNQYLSNAQDWHSSSKSLKEIALAFHQHQDLKGSLPPGTLPNRDLVPEKRLSWMVGVLPFLEQDALFKTFDRTRGWDDPVNRDAVNTHVRLFLNPANIDWPSGDTPGVTHYVGIAGVGADAPLLPADHPRAGVFGYSRTLKIQDIKDGTSNTIVLIDTASHIGPWAAGGFPTVRGLDARSKPYIGPGRPFGGSHLGFAMVAFADGSVRNISNSISPKTFEALATIAGGEIPGPDF